MEERRKSVPTPIYSQSYTRVKSRTGTWNFVGGIYTVPRRRGWLPAAVSTGQPTAAATSYRCRCAGVVDSAGGRRHPVVEWRAGCGEPRRKGKEAGGGSCCRRDGGRWLRLRAARRRDVLGDGLTGWLFGFFRGRSSRCR